MAASDADRRTQVVGMLHEALGSLIATLESGAGLDQALQGYIQETDNELSQAFAVVVEEIGAGVQRRVAARNLAARIDMAEVTEFVEAIIRADEEGTSLLEALKEQAGQIGSAA